MQLLSRLSVAAIGDPLVARRGNEFVGEVAFRARVAGWTAMFAGCDAREIALFLTDGVEFAAALFGGWYAHKTVYLAGDTLPATCRELAGRGVAFAGDFPRECLPLKTPPDGDSSRALAMLDANFTGAVIYTSGSTGEPQALPKKLSQLAAEVEMLDRQFGAELDDALFVSTVSHQHIYGLLFKILWPLSAGRPFLSESLTYPEQIAVQLAAGRSVLVSSPAHLKRLPAGLDWAGARKSTRAVFSSGGPLPAEAAASVESLLGIAPLEVYGSSETGGIAWRRQSGRAGQRWNAFPGIAVALRDGALSVKSPQLADDEWFSLADLADLHGDGTFTLAGRADRIAKIEGKRVSLTAIERALATSPLVDAARVELLQHERDTLGAIIVPSEAGWTALRTDGAGATGRRLRTMLADSTERVALPRRWRWLGALPANSQGKTTAAEIALAFAATQPVMPPCRMMEQSAQRAVLEIHLSKDLVYFDGHFAGAPVLAGVVQLEWAIEMGRKLFDCSGDFRSMEAIKFHRIFQPGPPLRMELDWRRDRAQLGFQFSSSEGRHSSGRIFFSS